MGTVYRPTYTKPLPAGARLLALAAPRSPHARRYPPGGGVCAATRLVGGGAPSRLRYPPAPARLRLPACAVPPMPA